MKESKKIKSADLTILCNDTLTGQNIISYDSQGHERNHKDKVSRSYSPKKWDPNLSKQNKKGGGGE